MRRRIGWEGVSRTTRITLPRVRTVAATRYVTPLREGGSLPALVETTTRALRAEVPRRRAGAESAGRRGGRGRVARALGLPVPSALVDLEAAIGRAEPDPEIQDLLRASPG